MQQIVIIGTGLAGYTLARELRARDKAARVTLISGDDGAFYAKPSLSNALRQQREPEQLVNFPATIMAERLDARILTHCPVERIDADARRVITEQGPVDYDQLVLAVGATPIRIPVPGASDDDILSVNNLGDYRHFRRQLEAANHVTIMGPGLIGCEFADDLKAAGKQVTVIGPDPHPVSTLLPASGGQALQRAMEQGGVEFRLGRTLTALACRDGRYLLSDSAGESFASDLLLSAVGLRPDLRLAESAGLETHRGIVTDRLLRTSRPEIFALGDCAEVAGRNLPFVMPLMAGAKALAATLAGEPTEVVYPPMPVVIKTTYPVVSLPPPPGADGDWQQETEGDGLVLRHRDPAGRLDGFVLTGQATARKNELLKALVPS